MQIRSSRPTDREPIAELIRASFPPGEHDDIVRLAQSLQNVQESGDVLSLVATAEERVIGFIAFSPLVLTGHDGWRGELLSPLGVSPAVQGQGVGTALVEAGLETLRQRAVAWAFVYGDPAYYGRFGFRASPAVAFRPPCALTYPHGWQALALAETSGPDGGDLVCVPALNDPELW